MAHAGSSEILSFIHIFLGSLPELVRDGENGLVFKCAGELAGQLEVGCKKINLGTANTVEQMLLTSFPNTTTLGKLRSSLQLASQCRASHPVRHEESIDWEWGTWTDNWNRVVKPLVLADVQRFE